MVIYGVIKWTSQIHCHRIVDEIQSLWNSLLDGKSAGRVTDASHNHLYLEPFWCITYLLVGLMHHRSTVRKKMNKPDASQNYGKCYKILNSSCLPKGPKQTAKTQIRLFLKKHPDQVFSVFYSDKLFWIPVLKTNMLLIEKCSKFWTFTKNIYVFNINNAFLRD